MSELRRQFEGLSTPYQAAVLSLVFDPIGAVGGYLLAPAVGIDPIQGALLGFVAAAIPTALIVARRR